MIVKRALEGLAGVKKAEVSFSERRAVVYYDAEKVRVEDMVQAVMRVGFRARELKGD